VRQALLEVIGGGRQVYPEKERRRLDGAGARVAPSVSLVIPAMNEERSLPGVLAELPESVDQVVVVDGHSVDRTAEVALETRPDAVVVDQPYWGKGDALRTGFAICRGDVIVMMDADGSMSPQEIPRFIEALRSGAEFVKGSRFLPTAGSDDLGLVHKLGNYGLRAVFNHIFGTKYTDLCYGYAAFWRRCLPILTIERDGFEVETELTVRSTQGGLLVCEVPSYELERQYGQSNLRAVRDGLRIARLLMSERSWTDSPAVISSEMHSLEETPHDGPIQNAA
jgi:glycosyltransferase involved in cell wall biosynthesis